MYFFFETEDTVSDFDRYGDNLRSTKRQRYNPEIKYIYVLFQFPQVGKPCIGTT